MVSADVLSCLEWWVCLLLLGIALLPLTMRLFRSFDDRGYAFSKVLGLGLVSLCSFSCSTFHLLPFTRWALIVLVALVVVVQAVWLVLSPSGRDAVGEGLRDPGFWTMLVLEELLFVLALALWSWVRAQAPDLSTLEKPMDHGFLAAILDSTYLPAQDMWYAGEGINYYYFGHFATAVLCRLTGIGSSVGYNLMVATTFAATFSTSSALVMDLACMRRRVSRPMGMAAGLIAGIVLCFGGNGHALVYRIILPLLGRLGVITWTETYWFADSTRYINCYSGSKDATIHEFPSYSFVVADLHAHMLDLCFVVVFLALALAFVIRRREEWQLPYRIPSREAFALELVLMGLLLGIMSMTNYWDFAVYLVVSAFLVLYVVLQREGRVVWVMLVEFACTMVLLYACARVVSFPFTLHFQMITASIAFVSQRSPFIEWLVLWYPALILIALHVVALACDGPHRGGVGEDALVEDVWEPVPGTGGRSDFEPVADDEVEEGRLVGSTKHVVGWADSDQDAGEDDALGPAGGGQDEPASEDVGLGSDVEDTAELQPLRWHTRLRFWIADLELPDLFVLVLLICAFGLIIVPEVVYVVDIYGTAPRANTMFKFTYQAFIMFSLALGYVIVRVLAPDRFRTRRWRAACGTVAALLVAISLVFAPGAMSYALRQSKGMLDGLAYIASKDPDEADAIAWVRDNTEPDAVILEAEGDSYTEYCRISSSTGRPTVLGWYAHEWLWRGSPADNNERKDDIETIYTSEDLEQVRDLLARYRVSYVYVGSRERERYAGLDEGRLSQLAQDEYRFGDVVLYRVAG